MKSFPKENLIIKLSNKVELFKGNSEPSQFFPNKQVSRKIDSNTSTPCICGCNSPMLMNKRNSNLIPSTPKENFLALLKGFLEESRMPKYNLKVIPESNYDIYDLFHCILKVRKHFGRISWKAVGKVLGGQHSGRELRQSLKAFYKDYLAAFEKWVYEKGPVTVGCIGTQIVVTILKDFLPGCSSARKEAYSPKEIESALTSDTSHEDPNDILPQEIVDLVDELIKKVEEIKEKEENEQKIKKIQQEKGLLIEEVRIEEKPQKRPIEEVEDEKSEEDVVFKQRKIVDYDTLPDIDSAIQSPIFIIKKIEVTPEKYNKNIAKKKKIEEKVEEKQEDIKEEKKSEKKETKSKKVEAKKTEINKEDKPESIPSSPKKESPKKQKPKKQDETPVPNPMASEFRIINPVDIGYRTNFISRYLPIEMQENHKRQEELLDQEKDSKSVKTEKETKAHFIRKKQSAVNIKRCCGVTYVKPTESKQEGVSDEFPPLPPLAFQVGTVDRLVPNEERPEYFTRARELIKSLFEVQGVVRVTIQQNYTETDLKRYVLGEMNDGEEVLVGDLSMMWRLLGKDNFVTIHLQMDKNSLLAPALPGKRGDVLLGFLVKKGLCGMRSVKRCLGLDELNSDPLNIYASQIRLELYLQKSAWKMADLKTRKLLCSFIYEFEAYIQRFLLDWNAAREKIYSTKTIEPMPGIYSWKKSCNCYLPENHITPTSNWTYSTAQPKPVLHTCPLCRSTCTTVLTLYEKGITEMMDSKNPPNWFYLINTRDSFSYDLHVKKTILQWNGKNILKREYFFKKNDLPSNYYDWEKWLEGDYVRVGAVSYQGVFTQEELLKLEERARETENDFRKGHFLQNTAQPSYGAGGAIKRTKFFFGTRYMWTALQLAERQSRVAAGVRVDVSDTPYWMKKEILHPLEDSGIIEKDFINSIAMNIYHDGKEGLAQHFDDAVRFKQPIYTVKLGSDARLSFGSQFYGYLNGAFCIPCPRGAVCVMEEFSYAANSAKHCVRPCDMSGRSITLILRQIHPFIMEEARRYDVEIDLPTWLSTLSLDDNAVPYYKQKEMEAKRLMHEDSEAGKKPAVGGY